MMCHPNQARLILMYKLSKCMPKITHMRDIEQCLEFITTKMLNTARGHVTGFETTAVGHGLAIDVVLMLQKSKNKNRAERLIGISGGNAYCIIHDLFSELLFGVTVQGKIIPLTWLHVLLICISPKDQPGQIVRLSLGGKTGKHPEVKALFLKHQYILQPTGARASSQNGSVERPHSTIGAAIRAMLYSSALEPKFWEYAFYFYLRVHTVLPPGKNKYILTN
jgi:hypothetical protein